MPIPFASIENDSNATPAQIIRWGQDGLVGNYSSGRLYLLRGRFVVPQLMGTSSAPVLSGTSASTIAHGTGNTLITLTGSNFLAGVAVTWNGAYRTTTIVDATHVAVAIPASDPGGGGDSDACGRQPGKRRLEGARDFNTLTVATR